MLHYFGFHRDKILVVLVILALMQVATFWLSHQLESKYLHQERVQYAEQVNKRIQQAIHDKQKATVAIGLMLSHSLNDKDNLTAGLPQDDIFERIRISSNYKNLWFQVVDRQGYSLYRSWTSKRGNLAKVRPEFEQIIRTKQPLTSISSGRFDLSIKAVVPIINAGEVLGFVDIISHFNSIQKRFEQIGIDSLVVANEERSKLINNPFSPHRLGPFYIANIEPNMEILNSIDVSTFQRWVSQPYSVWKDYLVIPYALVANNQRTHGHFLSFVPLESLHSKPFVDLTFQEMNKWVLQLDIALSLLLLVAFGFYLINTQKLYYKNILNAENEMVLVTDGQKIFDGNTLLFSCFPELATHKRACVCDYFIDEPGYLTKYVDDQLWLDYLLENQHQVIKAKVQVGDKLTLLNLKAQMFNEKRNLSVVVLTDITEIESLHDLSRTDPLTRAGNRRGFDFSLERAIGHSANYASNLVLMILDIDHFKKINDVYGHLMGDRVLKELSDQVFELIDHQQIFYRIGGEEFAIILEEVELDDALSMAEEIRVHMENKILTTPITVSIGLSAYQEGETLTELFQRADSALYKAKETGRNRVVMD